MMPAQGARLAFVVVKLEGVVKREVAVFERGKGIVKRLVSQPAGYIVYFPRGHILRVKDEETLERYGLHRKPKIISMQGLYDPNSPIGQLMMAQDEGMRNAAWADLEQQVIRIATANTGPIVMPEQLKNASLDLDEAA